MSESTRPPLKSAQQFLFVGLLVGLLLGCVAGVFAVYLYPSTTRITYVGGAHANELTTNYKNHYLAMAIDSYLVNQQIDQVEERLKSFGPAPKILGLASQAVAYGVSGRTAEVQMITNLALELKAKEGWDNSTIETAIGGLAMQYQKAGDTASVNALNQFSEQLLNQVMQLPETPVAEPATPGAPLGETPVAPETPADTPTDAPVVAESAPASSGSIWQTICLCLLGLLFIVTVILGILYIIRKRTEAQMSKKKEIVYKGEGKPPIQQWGSTYTVGRNPYDESITLETPVDNDFLGEAGIGMNDVVPGSNSGQVMDFDVWVFDKTDINTYSRIVMTEKAYNDEALRARVATNPLAEAVLAKQGEKAIIESKTMRIEVNMVEVEFDETNTFFNKFVTKMDIFLQEGIEIKAGEMVIPDHVGA
jgi:hypothetical protein